MSGPEAKHLPFPSKCKWPAIKAALPPGERSGGKLEKCVSTSEGAGEEKVHRCSVNFTWLNERLFTNGATWLRRSHSPSSTSTATTTTGEWRPFHPPAYARDSTEAPRKPLDPCQRVKD